MSLWAQFIFLPTMTFSSTNEVQTTCHPPETNTPFSDNVWTLAVFLVMAPLTVRSYNDSGTHHCQQPTLSELQLNKTQIVICWLFVIKWPGDRANHFGYYELLYEYLCFQASYKNKIFKNINFVKLMHFLTSLTIIIKYYLDFSNFLQCL